MPLDNNDKKLIAAVLGAAAAGAALAVTIMRSNEKKRDQFDPRVVKRLSTHKTVFMNKEPEDGMKRQDSEASLVFPHNHEEKMRRRVATRYSIEEENNTPRDSVTVRVPATSANMGPGCKSIMCQKGKAKSQYFLFLFPYIEFLFFVLL